ncbi:MAG: DUF4105 domain-containing protein [Myxococcales bacterium]|nr:DUF4105 domain-containing protein [Myxococcales bacterium]
MAAGLLLSSLLPLFGASGQTASATTAPPRVDLISIGVGSEMYAVFGHAAIRVVQPDGTDTAYNFGGVDMEQPNFWTRLIQGRIEAFLDVTPYADLLLKYSGEDRTIVGRTLDFTPDEARRLVARLDQIAASDERTYLYHHIYDNCTTRVGGVFDEILGGRLKEAGAYPVRGTHRTWILDRIRDRPLLYLAMDLAGNGMGDVPLTAWDTIFIPEAFDRVVDRARIHERPFVLSTYVDYRSMTFEDRPLWDWPWTKVYLLFALPLLGLALWRPRPATLVWGLAAGLMGLTYVVFQVASDYPFYHYNVNMLLFPPTHLYLVWAALSARRWAAPAPRLYLLAHAALVLVVWAARALGFIVQDVDPMLGVAVPVAVSLAWRVPRPAKTER